MLNLTISKSLSCLVLTLALPLRIMFFFFFFLPSRVPGDYFLDRIGWVKEIAIHRPLVL